MSIIQSIIIATVSAYAGAGLVFWLWWRREKKAFENDVEDLSLSPEQLEAKYRARRT